MPHTPITGREWRGSVGWLALHLFTASTVARHPLCADQETKAPRSTREDLLHTEKRCVGGQTARDLGSTAVENAKRFRIVNQGGESRLTTARSTHERDVCPPTQRWSHQKEVFSKPNK
jgi:hypothetical protein